MSHSNDKGIMRILAGAFFSIFLVNFLLSCHRLDGDGHARIITQRKLEFISSLFKAGDIDPNEIDLIKCASRAKALSEVLNIPRVDQSFLLDGWGREFLCVLSDGKLYLWSRGKNSIDESRRGDDIAIEVDATAYKPEPSGQAVPPRDR